MHYYVVATTVVTARSGARPCNHNEGGSRNFFLNEGVETQSAGDHAWLTHQQYSHSACGAPATVQPATPRGAQPPMHFPCGGKLRPPALLLRAPSCSCSSSLPRRPSASGSALLAVVVHSTAYCFYRPLLVLLVVLVASGGGSGTCSTVRGAGT